MMQVRPDLRGKAASDEGPGMAVSDGLEVVMPQVLLSVCTPARSSNRWSDNVDIRTKQRTNGPWAVVSPVCVRYMIITQ